MYEGLVVQLTTAHAWSRLDGTHELPAGSRHQNQLALWPSWSESAR